MGLSEKIRQQLITAFKVEQGEHVQKITAGLLALEKEPQGEERQAVLQEIFREAHSLKGAARAVGLTVIGNLGHSLEDLLLKAKEGRLAFTPELFDLLYQALDAVSLVMEQMESGNSSPPARVLALLVQLEEISAKTDQPPASEHPPAQEAPARETATRSPLPTPVENEAADSSTPPAAIMPPAGYPAEETIRVSINKLDALMEQFSELLGAKIRAEQRLTEVRQLQAFAADWQKSWLNSRSHYSRLLRNGHEQTEASPSSLASDKDVAALLNFSGRNQEQLRTFVGQANTLYRQLANDTMRLSLIIDELQEEIKRVRMLPLATITTTFSRMVRDLAREQSKQINLHISGEETELDKRVLEQIKDPLIHLLRNAVDHGIEPVTARKTAGKEATGTINLAANQQGNNIVITLADDGQGLDLALIRKTAVQKAFLTAGEAEQLNDDDAALLIFNSGLSTSKMITDVSGRGIGLDVVRKNVEELHGTLSVHSQPGQGTRFTLTLPLTLASSRGLLVRAGKQRFALPLTTVERMLHVPADQLHQVEGRPAITYQGKPVALAWLEDLLELPTGRRTGDDLTVVIIGVTDKRLGLVVDDLAGEQEIVMKSLGRQLVKVGGLAGATVLGSGEVILVLHAADLVKLSGRVHPRSSQDGVDGESEPENSRRVLIVDDSITTRTLEKSILEAAGYEVRVATDGQEALGALVSENLPNLVVSDINMPRLDGFALTSRIKNDARYQDIPVILVTSLDSPADKARGIEVGADAYIVKSRFDQGNLLETIEQLLV